MTLFPCLSQKSKVLSGLTLNKVVYFFSILLMSSKAHKFMVWLLCISLCHSVYIDVLNPHKAVPSPPAVLYLSISTEGNSHVSPTSINGGHSLG